MKGDVEANDCLLDDHKYTLDALKRPAKSISCGAIFGEDVGDARTTEFLHRDSHLFAAGIRGLSRLCSTRDIITGTKRTGNTGPIRVSARSQIGARAIS